MFRRFLLAVLGVVAVAAGRGYSLDVASAPAGDVAARIASSKGDIRLEGDEVTEENIQKLAVRNWDSVVLVSDHINGAVLEALRNVPSIHSLSLYGGGYSGNIGRLAHVQLLVELKLAGRIDGHDLTAIGVLTELTSLKLPQDMTINTVGAQEIAQLTKLKSLDLYDVDIDDSGFAELSTLVNLENLDLTHTRVTDEGLKTLAKMPKLKTLELYRHWGWVKQQISDECLPVIAELTELERLSLSGEVSDEGMKVVATLPHLKDLSIGGTRVFRDGFAALQDTGIESLELTLQQLGNDPEESSGAALKKMKALKRVFVHSGQGSLDFDKWGAALPGVGFMESN